MPWDQPPLSGLSIILFRKAREDVKKRCAHTKASPLTPCATVLTRPFKLTVAHFVLMAKIYVVPYTAV